MENLIRLSVAVGIFAIMATWEAASPRRTQQVTRKQRWPVNLGLALFNMLVMRFTVGSLAYLSAIWARDSGYGVLNHWPLPESLSIIATLLLLDFAIYGQHILMHKWPPLWRLHKIHHTDLEFDATTAVRFHPLEIIVSMFYKAWCIALIGGNPLAVIVFEIVLNGAATFNHSNIHIPEKIDKALRWLIITPDMHRIHHSANQRERDSNYGFSVSWWDRLCQTYTATPKQAQTAMTIGLLTYRKQSALGFMKLLVLPFQVQAKR